MDQLYEPRRLNPSELFPWNCRQSVRRVDSGPKEVHMRGKSSWQVAAATEEEVVEKIIMMNVKMVVMRVPCKR